MIAYAELDRLEIEAKKKLAAMVKERRGKMSVYELSAISKVGEDTIRRIENGKGCTWGIAEKICKTLDINIMLL